MTTVGPGELLIILIVALVLLVPPVWSLADLFGRPPESFDTIGQSRTVWIGLLLVGIVLCGGLGLVAGVYYLVRVRPQLDAA